MPLKLPIPLITPVRVVLPKIILAVIAIIVAVSTTHTIMCWMSEAHYTPSMAALDQATLMRADEKLQAEIIKLQAEISKLRTQLEY